MTDRAGVEEHYRLRWGAPDDVEELVSGSLRVFFYKWEKSSRTGGVSICATYGASIHRDAHGSGAEIVVGLAPDCDEIRPALADLVATVVELKKDLAHGQTWHMGDHLWEGTELNFLLTMHQHASIEPLVDSDGGRTEFFNAVPVFEYEAELVKAHGLDALKQSWKENRVRFWDPTRSPLFRR